MWALMRCSPYALVRIHPRGVMNHHSHEMPPHKQTPHYIHAHDPTQMPCTTGSTAVEALLAATLVDGCGLDALGGRSE